MKTCHYFPRDRSFPTSVLVDIPPTTYNPTDTDVTWTTLEDFALASVSGISATLEASASRLPGCPILWRILGLGWSANMVEIAVLTDPHNPGVYN